MPGIRPLIDQFYRHLRPWRFLWGWAMDSHYRAQANARATTWQERNFVGAKLDVCGGRNPFKPGEYLNVDVVALPQVDLVFDITKKFPMEDNVIEEIISIATLEHLRKPHVDHVLREFQRILKPGGMLRVSTPDIEAIARAIIEKKDLSDINQNLFGKYKSDQTEDYDTHKWMYPADEMIRVLQSFGFENAERIPFDIGMHDPEYTYLIRAYKKA
jgi:predicted SAM-dependent methyltransferase